MGQTLCMQTKIQLPDIEEDLLITDPIIIDCIQEIRDDNEEYIERSSLFREKNGAIYRGTYNKHNQKQGYGQYFQKNIIYFGFFNQNLPEGYGLAVKNGCEYYKGFFSKGRYQNSGRQYSQNHQFEGEYENGMRKKGILRTNEYEYNGEFYENLYHGQGRINYNDGRSYQGFFAQGKFDGKGILIFSNGNVYEGFFKQGKYHGEGKFSWTNGMISFGMYEDGVCVKKQIKYQSNNNSTNSFSHFFGSKIGNIAASTLKRWNFQWLIDENRIKIVNGQGFITFD